MYLCLCLSHTHTHVLFTYYSPIITPIIPTYHYSNIMQMHVYAHKCIKKYLNYNMNILLKFLHIPVES